MYVESDKKLRTILKSNNTVATAENHLHNVDHVINKNTDETKVELLNYAEWNCSMCHQQFTTEISLNNHENVCTTGILPHRIEANISESKSNVNHINRKHIDNNAKKANISIWECYKCHIEFKTMQELKMHNNRCRPSPINGGNIKYKGNYRINENGQFICNLCDSIFRSRKSVYDHIRQHSGQKFLCNICGRFLSSRNNLTKHYRTVHLKEKKYRCLVCEKRYDSSYRLRIHKNAHEGIRQFDCKLCSRNFLTSSSLSRHKKTVHNQGQLYSCTICYRKFNVAYNMRIHMATHTGIHPHICCHCNAGFHRKRKLELHVKEVHGL